VPARSLSGLDLVPAHNKRKAPQISALITSPPATEEVRLIDIGRPLSLRAYLAELWRHRSLIMELARADLRQRHVDTALGNVWYFLNPLLLTGIYFWIFVIILETTRNLDKVEFLPYLAISVGLFQFSQRATMSGAKSLILNQRLVRLIRFPRAVLPISGVVAELGAVGPALVVGMAVAIIAGEPPGFDWLLVIPAAALLALFVMGLTLIAARLSEASGDILNLLPWLFRILFYLSGVIYSVDKFITQEWQRNLFLLNPLHPLLSLVRYPIVPEASPIDGTIFAVAVGWTVVALTLGMWFFRRGEADYGRE
jgi:teichoic acid transport system permease protein